ncbi:hypothetical protein BOO69_09550 [Sulfitobacter alexandrii]|uniref:DUF3164 family protein n=1 Tax=Sulfitobacter alexandrii TaxID=1917485 RepID=A0A1J0WH37_9RHOB|nr:DUF3164 family protein [Sulfitobacter alexandrii]APE43631.1 hypothetical protein BOO69_09550 [Sulfitobacter alexandrii]
MTNFTPAPIPDGRKDIEGRTYMGDGKGGWQPIETIKAQHLLEDETVRKIVGYAKALSGQVARFKEHTFDDIGAFEAILAQEYDAKLGGKKGNATLMTVDGLYKVTVSVADRIVFGPELQTAKAIFDECLNEWSADARAELRGLVTDAFNTDKEGTVNKALIFVLLRRESDDPRWKRGQDAIRDAMRVVGSKTYHRAYCRDKHDAPWQPITIDLAKA